MSIKTSSNWLQNLCSLEFFKAKDLRRSSLNKPLRPAKIQTQCPKTEPLRLIEEQIPSRKTSLQESKRDFDTPVKNEKRTSITEKDFRIMQILRSGINWKTFLVKKENEDKVYAMKLIGRKRMAKNSVADQVAMEREILEKAKHPFIPKLAWYFENEKKIFIVMEFVEGGGTLHHILRKLSRFSEEITRFYSAEIILTLEYLHKELQVAYNDVRLRHFLLDSQGHIKLIDFCQAKKINSRNSLKDSPLSSPYLKGEETRFEQMNDFLALGHLIYELLTGKKPYVDENGCDDISNDEISPTSQLSWPSFVSKNAKDLITRLLNPNTSERLGFNGFDEIKKHAFFAQTNWDKMLSKSVYPPLTPSQFKDEQKDFEDMDEDWEEVKGFECLKPYSLDKIPEGSSLVNSDEDVDAMSFDRTTGISSILGHH